MWTRPLAIVCAAVLSVGVLAGCGDSPAKTAPTGGSSPTPSTTPASQAELGKIVLQTADLPAGSKGSPYKADPRAAENHASMMKCIGARNTDPGKFAEAHSEEFALGSGAVVSSTAASYRSQSDVDADIAMLKSPKVSPCLEQMLRKLLAPALPPGVTIASSSMKVTPGPTGGPANVAGTGIGTINVKVNGEVVPGHVTVAYINGPLIKAQVVTLNVGKRLPASQVKSLVAAVATRAATE